MDIKDLQNNPLLMIPIAFFIFVFGMAMLQLYGAAENIFKEQGVSGSFIFAIVLFVIIFLFAVFIATQAKNKSEH